MRTETNFVSSWWEILTGVLIPVLLYFMSAFLTFLLPFCWISGLLLTLTHTSNIRKTMTIGGKLLLFCCLVCLLEATIAMDGCIDILQIDMNSDPRYAQLYLFVVLERVLFFCYFGPVVGWLLTRICFLVSYSLLSYIFTPFPFFRISSIWFFSVLLEGEVNEP